MHVPAKHALLDVSALCRFIKTNPLGVLTTAIKSPKCETIQSSHMPWLLDRIEPDENALPVLRGHMARSNPQAQAIIHELTQRPRPWPEATSSSHQLEDEVLIMFTSPAHHYISPSFYKETKPMTGKVAPTWNYSAVQAYGRATIFMDTKAGETVAFLGKQLRDLSNMCETEIMDFKEPWLVEDAPTSYTDMLMKGIIGIQVEITKLEGRIKVSQDKPLGDRLGVVEGLKALQMPSLQPLIDQTQEQSDLREKT